MINYYCPDFYNGRFLYEIFFKWKREYPEYFLEDANIKVIFGSLPNMIFNGGSVITGKNLFFSEIKDLKDFYKENNIKIQLTCTNPLISKEYLDALYDNKILEIFEDSFNHVLVSTELMYKYIKKYYPLYHIDRSIINTEQDYDWEQVLNEKYSNIVMPRRHCYDIQYLKNIKYQYRKNIEILVNDPCPINCPFLYEHYKQFARLTLRKGPDLENAIQCKNLSINDQLIPMDYKYLISEEDIRKKYLPLGYTEFKLSGRGTELKILESIIPYLVKPKYQISIFSKIIQELK